MDQNQRDQHDQPPGGAELELPGRDWLMDLSAEPPRGFDPSPPTVPPLPPDDRYDPGRRGPRGYAWLGWVLTIIGCVMVIVSHNIPSQPQAAGQQDVGAILMEVQGKYIVGAAHATGGAAPGSMSGPPTMLYSQASSTLNLGSVAQRQRFAVIAAELRGPDEAQQQLARLDELIADEVAEIERQKGVGHDQARQQVMTDGQKQVQDLLHAIYDVGEDGGWEQVRANVDTFDADQRQVLKDHLGWFGKLALAPPGTDDPSRRTSVLRSARAVMFTLVGVFSVVALIGFLGFVLLIVFFVLTVNGTVRSGMERGRVHHGLYAETFGIWLIVFIVAQLAGGVVLLINPALALPATAVAFFGSLAVLVWPVFRGARWQDVRADLGLTRGRRPALEPAIGAMGYAMAIPLLAVGIVLTLVLIQVQAFFASDPTPLTPAGGPAHPIILELAGPSIWPKLMLLFLAAVAAPIVEETMFRGVLYRHLRDASGHMGRLGSVAFSSTLSGFIFAVIHPQGWVAIPALMALAYAFCLVREWRGTIIPAMVIHGISNFIVMTTMITLFSL